MYLVPRFIFLLLGSSLWFGFVVLLVSERLRACLILGWLVQSAILADSDQSTHLLNPKIVWLHPYIRFDKWNITDSVLEENKVDWEKYLIDFSLFLTSTTVPLIPPSCFHITTSRYSSCQKSSPPSHQAQPPTFT